MLRKLYNRLRGERYFFISYTTVTKVDGCLVNGNLYFNYIGFPSNKQIKQFVASLRDDIDTDAIVIMFITEFDSQSDYYKFKGK